MKKSLIIILILFLGLSLGSFSYIIITSQEELLVNYFDRDFDSVKCPKCGSKNVEIIDQSSNKSGFLKLNCNNCGYIYHEKIS
ncbi:MAG: hypothetical protein ACP5C3_01905 [Methanomicrobiales archaeon]